MVRTFDGRDSREEFWPFCATMFGGWLAIGNLCFVAVFISTSTRDRRDVIAPFVVLTVLSAVVLVALLAAAVARRLHDRQRSGVWGAAPLVPAAVCIVLIATVLRTYDQDSGPGLFLVAFGADLIYFATLIALIIELARPGIPDERG